MAVTTRSSAETAPASRRPILLVVHCILNHHTVIHGLVKNRDVAGRLVRLALDHQVGLIQLGCPEFVQAGPRRWAQSYEQYDTTGFRRCCAALAATAGDQIEDHLADGGRLIAYVGICGSPSCSSSITTSAAYGGLVPGMDGPGAPPLPPRTKVAQAGHLTQAVERDLQRRGITCPMLELPPDDCTLADGDEFIRQVEWLIMKNR